MAAIPLDLSAAADVHRRAHPVARPVVREVQQDVVVEVRKTVIRRRRVRHVVIHELDFFLLDPEGQINGSKLTYAGLLTPNLFAGGEAFHSKLEWVPVQVMEKPAETIVDLAVVWAEKNA